MASKIVKKARGKQRVARATSNIFAMFDQSQIQEFKEAFNMIDQNRDGFIDEIPTDAELNEMIEAAPGPINFTMFLTMFGDKMNGTDPEEVIRNAFACFDEKNTGKIHKDEFISILTTLGDRFTKEEIEATMKSVAMDPSGFIDHVELSRVIKHGTKEDVQP